jgi:DNA-binding phage protein
MPILTESDAVALLRAEVEKAGSVAAWARSASLDRTHVSSAVYQRRPISKRMLRALGLRKAVINNRFHLLDESEIRKLLRAEVAAAGGQSAWAKKHRISRPFLNYVLREREPPSENILRALGLRIVVMSD